MKKNNIPNISYKKKNKKSKNTKKDIISNNKKNTKNFKIPNKDLKTDDFIKIIPFGNSLTQTQAQNKDNSFDKLSSFFDILLKKDIKKEKEFIPLDVFKIDSEISYEEHNNEVSNLDDLIDFAKSINENKNYSFDIKKLTSLISPLERLKDFIGMVDIKNSIVKQIIYFLQNLDNETNIMHTVITGSPGLGKTKLGYLLAEIYYKMNVFMSKNEEKKYISPITNENIDFKFTIAKRSDLIGEYVGHTAIKTQNLINKSLGGVLFIDEAYSLGNDKKDSFSKECIDTINQNLTENKGKFLVIIAGYEDELEENFFSFNEGLKRRFAFKYNIVPYEFNELGQIFLSKLNSNEWSLDKGLNLEENNELYNFFKKNYRSFKYYGGDMELLLFSTKIAHSLRIFCKNPKLRKIINISDIINGFEIFKNTKKEGNTEKPINSMYL